MDQSRKNLLAMLLILGIGNLILMAVIIFQHHIIQEMSTHYFQIEIRPSQQTLTNINNPI